MNRKTYVIFFGIALLLIIAVISVILSMSGILGEQLFSTRTPSPIPTNTPLPLPTPTPTPVPEARIKQGDQALFFGDYDLAYREYETALTAVGDAHTQAAALMGMGHVHYLRGDYDLCLQAYGTVLASYDTTYHATANYFMAQCYENLGNIPLAVRSLDAYIDNKPGVLDDFILEQKGDLLLKNQETTQALDAYTLAVDAAETEAGVLIKIKMANIHASQGDYENTVRILLPLFDQTQNSYTKAQINLLLGNAYINLGLPEQAYARYQDSINNYPETYDAYSSLVYLVDNNIPVSSLSRGLVNYHVGQYGLASNYLNEYIKSTPDQDATARHYRALSLRAMEEYQAAIDEWQEIINNHVGEALWLTAYEEKAYTQWAFMNQHERAAQTLLDYVNRVPDSPSAPSTLYDAARILERSNDLTGAAAAWERMIVDYPADPLSQRGMILAGICYYRLNDMKSALTTFQRALVLATSASDQAAAMMWTGKVYEKQGVMNAAMLSYQQAADLDPTGYYSERSRELSLGLQPLTTTSELNLDHDLDQERGLAEAWLRFTFSIPEGTNLSGLGLLVDDPDMARGNALWNIGLFKQADERFTRVRLNIKDDAVRNYYFLNHMLSLGFYQQAIYASRQILDLANMDDLGTLSAPVFFNHVRFGVYYKDIVLEAAEQHNVSPILLLSMIRQESMFTGFAGSSAGAHGALQLLPSTAQDVVNTLNWPPNYTPDDLFRPIINIPLGTVYFSKRLAQFNGNAVAALAGYNGGPGNAMIWDEMSGGDPDLMLEIIRFSETRNYVMQISEFFHIYQRLYGSE